MSLTPAEFRLSLGRLDVVAAAASDGPDYSLALPGGGLARISAEPIEPLVIGGLLRMPRCRVVIAFEGASEADTHAFMRRFDIAFQRGGG